MQPTDVELREEVYSVSQLNNEVRFLLEDTYPLIWVEGEISNFAAPGSGHWYFSLKDANAQVRCAMFRGSQRKLDFAPKDGLHILIRARVSLYPNRGEYQLIAEHMEERGEGKLRRAFELLKKKLETAGLFSPEHKKPLPPFPRQIGVITSATGAAIRDILHVLKRRYACAPVIIYPTLVQGTTAAPAIVKAIETANCRNECDVLIVARGGGSLEDLWPFNEEKVAQAIYNSKLPIVSGIGHEIDFTIADFVADVRAPTPSAAAEIITPDRVELSTLLTRQLAQLNRCMQSKLKHLINQLEWTQKHLTQQHPKRRLMEKMQRVDFCELTLTQLQTRLIHRLRQQLNTLETRLQRLTPIHQISRLQHQLSLNKQFMQTAIQHLLNQRRHVLAQAAGTLDALSPLATLKRGYAIASDKEQRVLYQTSQVQIGDQITVKLADGNLNCTVKHIEASDSRV